MATQMSRPGRTLAVFLLVVAAMFGGAIALGDWKPNLGLDLQGGTRITLQAEAVSGAVTENNLNQAVDIISSRVNGAGVAEAEVTTQGSDIILVEIPGKENKDLARSVGTTAQLRFRLVAIQMYNPALVPTQTPTPTQTTGTPPTTAPTTGATTAPTTAPGVTSPTGETTGTAPTNQRVRADWMVEETTTPTDETTTTEPTEPTETTGVPTGLVPPVLEDIKDPLNWTPSNYWQNKLAQFRCPADGSKPEGILDIPSQPLVTCDAEGNKYLLGPTMIEGTELDDASAQLPQQGTAWVVNLDFDSGATKTFREITNAIANQTNPLTGQQKQFAIVLDGQVISAPVVNSPINDGRAMIEGSSEDPFTQESASALANSLKYGALPLAFEIQSITNEGPELAGNQLDAGILAGIVGLILVVAYCLMYYRGLGLVVIASLLIAGLMTYAAVLLLGEAYGFTLTLPGIAGLIVAVGITADSFIVYFERLRDEVRDGKSLRTAVETGWVRARATILAADSVSMLAALVLFIFAIGVVKGFAFALGLITFIDVFVVFFFTKPMVTMLARTKFFGQGHKLSGLDRTHLGLEHRPARTVGGEA